MTHARAFNETAVMQPMGWWLLSLKQKYVRSSFLVGGWA
jgi:hypothetical protein